MQIIKPGKLSLISKTYGFNGHQFSVGALCFFKLGADNALLTEISQWPRIIKYLENGDLLDMGFAKPNGELLIAGRAFAPNKIPVTNMTVTVSLGKVKKSLKIIGDRYWSGGLFSSVSTPVKFTDMPLIYQNAYGAVGYEQNPLGKGVINKKYKNKETDSYALPNIYLEKESPKADKEVRSVAGFGPLSIQWPQRTRYQGSYNKQWLENDRSGFPKDTNPKLFNSAPLDQQIEDFFQPDTAYSIKGMNVDYHVTEGRLPNIKVRAFICQHVKGVDVFKEISTAIDTVWFFPELELGVCIYRGVTQVNDSDGLDVKKLMLACEGANDAPRTIEYYQDVITLRTDPETALAHVFNESQLMPMKTKDQQQHYDNIHAEAKRLHQQKIDHITELQVAKIQADNPNIQLPSLEKTPPDVDEPGPIPQELLESGDIDLSPYIAYANMAAKKANADMELQLSELKQLQAKYSKQQDKACESSSSMKARVNNRVYVTATDLEAFTSYQPPEWMTALPPENALTFEQQKQVWQAEQSAAKNAREARQNAPEVTVLAQPLPENGAQQMREWVIVLMASSVSLAGRDLAGADLSGLDFSGLDLRDVMLEKTDLTSCNFAGCRLDGAVFTSAILNSATFTNCSMIKANLALTYGKETRFNHSNLSHSNVTKAEFDHCDFSDAILDHILAVNVNMQSSVLHRIQCEKGTFMEAKLTQSDWQKGSLKNCIFFQPELQGANWQNITLERCMMLETKAEGADFAGIKAEKVQFSNKGDFLQADFSNGLWKTCGFRGLDMSQSKGNGSVFIECDFGEALLESSHYQNALFHNCIMTLAKFDSSDLKEVCFNASSLRKCQFIAVDLRGGEFFNNDLTDAVFDDCLTDDMKQSPMPLIN
ncbi:DUF2169 domain-containing protein [Marinomonas sp. RS-M-Aa-14]|uniref:DUF2169 family type VI secretion system accessory protein n=2 Tax=Marinomonas TaxID=28253 RepID=UPI00390C5009